MQIERLQQLRDQQRLSLMTHVIAGYPSLDENRELVKVMAQEGVGILEVQIPFSEPIADGPLFVKANQGALDSGIGVEQVLGFLTETAASFPGPVLMMGYFNTILALGENRALELFQQAGLSGFIVPDLPPDHESDFLRNAPDHDLAPILLVAPNTDDERMQSLAPRASGMVYAVARKGVTGKKTDLDSELSEYLQRCRRHFKTTLAVGFGLSSAEDIAFLKERADVAIVGSALLNTYLKSGTPGVSRLLSTLDKARQ